MERGHAVGGTRVPVEGSRLKALIWGAVCEPAGSGALPDPLCPPSLGISLPVGQLPGGSGIGDSGARWQEGLVLLWLLPTCPWECGSSRQCL